MVADDVYPGTKHNGASVCSLYLLEKMESKINCSNIFWDYNVRILFKNHFFFITGVRVKFDSKDSKINFDRARSTTVKSLLGALRALYNISSDDGEDLFADELLVY